MALRLSRNKEWVAQSEIRNMTLECARVKGINLAQGICDLPVPALVRQGARDAVDQGYNIYTRYDGLAELRRAIAGHYKTHAGLALDPDSEIVVSCGATGVFYCACLALLDPGDEVILFTPYYGYHISTLASVGAVPVYAPLTPPDWSFAIEDLERVVTPKTKALLLNTPANPSGKVFSLEELRALGAFAERHDLFLFTDEIYEHFVYDGLRHVSPATLPGLRERTIAMSGASKSFSITGWRIGWSYCDKAFSQTIGHFNDLVYVCAPAPLQIGVARGLDGLGPEYYRDLAADLQSKRDRFCAALQRAGLTPYVPKGAYYVLSDISRLPGADSKERAMHLLRATGLACVPGKAFYPGAGGEGLARFCFAKEDPVLDEACRRLDCLA